MPFVAVQHLRGRQTERKREGGEEKEEERDRGPITG